MKKGAKDIFLKLGFILLPFNNFPKIEVFDNVFFLSFLWAVIFVIMSIVKGITLGKLKINKYFIGMHIFLFYIIIRNLSVFYEAIYRQEYFYALKNIFHYLIWILTSTFLYNVLKYKTNYEKERLLKLALKSFSITGIVEILNLVFNFYERDYTKAYGILRINPLSSESSYYNINIAIFIFTILYLKDRKKLKKFENIMVIFLITIIFFSFSSTGFFIIVSLILLYFLRRNFQQKMILIMVLVSLFSSLNYFGNENKYYRKIEIQGQKIIEYALGKKSNDYSTDIRNKVKEIYGKNLFKNHVLIGNGMTGIYRISRLSGYGIENKINSDAKNFYWTILAQEGVVGGTFYLVLFFSIYFNIKKTNVLRKYFLSGYLVLMILLNAYNNIWIQSLWIIYPLVLTYNRKIKNDLQINEKEKVIYEAANKNKPEYSKK